MKREYLREEPSLGSVIYYEGNHPYLVIGHNARPEMVWVWYLGTEKIRITIGQYPWRWFTRSQG